MKEKVKKEQFENMISHLKWLGSCGLTKEQIENVKKGLADRFEIEDLDEN